jgi:hypothetical protein
VVGVNVNDIKLQFKMDIIIKEHDLGEGTSPVSTLKKEELIDIKYEDHYDPMPSPAISNKYKVSFILKFRLILHEHLFDVDTSYFSCSDMCDNIRMLFRL